MMMEHVPAVDDAPADAALPEPRKDPMQLRSLLQSRTALVLGVVVSVLVPVLTLPRIPHVSPWPVALGLLPWVIGKYVLCPLRWRAVTDADLGRRWHLRAYAESELLGLLTPGHVGADAWRYHRLTKAGLRRGDAVASVGTDRLLGALGLAAFVVFAGSELPLRMLLPAVGLALAALVALVVVRRFRPDLLPRRPLPPPRRLAHGLLLSAGYQLSIAGLLLGTLAATGHSLSPLQLLGAFGASQVAGAVPGPNGASPRDGALVVALVALGVPWAAAAAAVAIKAAVAWLPALALGGVSLVLARRAARTPAPVTA
ncbi:flippase-like domain-containing protein [Nocardioides guangzhouensis]|uniref:Flippase-like domain-containing protein n=2 Tax=Nocardioides guangzhouensis TaxID=2497878 RepID=A0A4Q4ZH79_9ACTN|nr:flippase-like domain-containing protein [Nocardioides guangzhouensis]